MSDRDYFDSYAGAEVHRLMLADNVRTEAYRDALESLVEPGMTVLDVGCGTGILSLFAARAGAEQVFAVDRSEILQVTERIVRRNDLSQTIKCFPGKAESIELPCRVDLIVSEWMGFFALAEAMFESVVAARDRHLRHGGALVPGAIRLMFGPIEDARIHREHGLGFWSEPVYGFDYAPMLDYEIADLETVSVRGDRARRLGPPTCVADIDCLTDPIEDYWFDARVRIPIQTDGELHGFLGHFEAQLAPDVMLSTANDLPMTHWRQSWFPVRARPVREGDHLELDLRAEKDPRGDGRRPIYYLEGRHYRGVELLDSFFYCHHGTFD